MKQLVILFSGIGGTEILILLIVAGLALLNWKLCKWKGYSKWCWVAAIGGTLIFPIGTIILLLIPKKRLK